MSGNKSGSPSGPREIAGNKTTVNPGEAPVSQYLTSTVTNYVKEPGKPPAVGDIDVASARHFVQDNKK